MRGFALALVVSWLLASVAAAQCAGGRLGHWGGAARAVAAAGTTIYAVIGSDFVVLDAFNPGQPVEVGRTPLEYPALRLAAADWGGLVVAASYETLLVIDASDRRNPHVVSTLEGTGGSAVACGGGYAYVGSLGSSFRVIDLSAPTQPRIIAELSNIGIFRDIVVGAGFVYAGVDTGMLVIDVRNPAAPAVVDSLDFVHPAIDFLGDTLALAADGAVRIYDVSQGDRPLPRGEVSVPGVSSVSEVVVTAGYVYVSDGGQVLTTIDIHDPSHPGYVNVVAADSVWGMTRLNGFVVSAAGGKGVRTFGPFSGLIGRYGVAGSGTNFAVRGNTAYYAAGPAGLQILDISDLRAPHRLAEVPPSSHYDESDDVALYGDRAFVANAISGINIYDIADPQHPQSVGSVAGHPRRVLIDGGFLYAIFDDIDSAQTSAVDIFDALDTEPRRICRLEFPVDRRALDIAVRGNQLAVGRRSGVTLYDVADPSAPAVVFERETINASIPGVAIDAQNRVFAASSAGMIDVFDALDGARLGSFHVGDRSHVSVAGDRLYATGVLAPTAYDVRERNSFSPIREYPIQSGGGGDNSRARQVGGLFVVGSTLEGLVFFQAGGAGDLDRDGVVGVGDLAILLAHFGMPVENGLSDGDLDCDGEVSLNDLLTLLDGWGY